MPSWEDVVAIGLELPEVEEATWNGTPSLKVGGKSFARLRDEDGLCVLMVDMLEREALIQSDPDAYLVTPHYQDYPAMLVNLDRVDPEELREQVIEAWRRKASKRLIAAWEAGT